MEKNPAHSDNFHQPGQLIESQQPESLSSDELLRFSRDVFLLKWFGESRFYHRL